MRWVCSLWLALHLFWTCEAGEDWSYDPADDVHGPAHWPGVCTQGEMQSPINFPPSGLERSMVASLQFENYEKMPASISMLNNGHTVKLTFNPSSDSETSLMGGGGLPTRYKLAQIHFHWGEDAQTGSEHQVSNRSYPLEMHLVHYKEEYPDLNTAVQETDPNTLAVLGVLFEIAETDNENLASIIDKLGEIQEVLAQTEVPPFPLMNLLPDEWNEFYRYNGSLTTPGCNEIVLWTVLKDAQRVSEKQLAKFRQIKDTHGKNMLYNYRPVQSKGSRRVLDVSALSDSATSLFRDSFLSSNLLLLYLFLH